ncbi:MAG: helix-turn-helix domain-containing protein [Myxococcota bacterium]
MSNDESPTGTSLAARFRDQLKLTGLTIDALAERTKIPRATIQWILEEEVAGVLPDRAYLRGHTATLAKELGMDVEGALGAFDQRMPRAQVVSDEAQPVFPRNTALVGAGLGCLAVITMVLVFASAL